MSATSLAEAIQAELIARDMNWSAFMRAAKISQRTMQALREGDEDRVFGHTLLAKIDDVFGFERGTLYRIWKAQPRSVEVDEMAIQLRRLEDSVAEMRRRPSWWTDVFEMMQNMPDDERDWWITGMRREDRRRRRAAQQR